MLIQVGNLKLSCQFFNIKVSLSNLFNLLLTCQSKNQRNLSFNWNIDSYSILLRENDIIEKIDKIVTLLILNNSNQYIKFHLYAINILPSRGIIQAFTGRLPVKGNLTRLFTKPNMGEIVFKEGVNPSVKFFHDGKICTLSSYVQNEVEKNERNTQSLISIPFKCCKI